MSIDILLIDNILNLIRQEISETELPQVWDPKDLPSDEKPVGEGEVGVLYVQPNGIMWIWSSSKGDYIQLNGLTDLSEYDTRDAADAKYVKVGDIDVAPVDNSTNPVSSGGVYSAIEDAVSKSSLPDDKYRFENDDQLSTYFEEYPEELTPGRLVISGGELKEWDGNSWERVIYGGGAIAILQTQIATVSDALTAHVDHDADLYQSILAAARAEAQAIYEGTSAPLSSEGTVIIGTGGLLTLGGSGEYEVPQNGGITITFSAVLALGNATVSVNGEEVFNSSVLSIISIPPPITIRVNGGDKITSGGTLGLLSSLNVTFYPNKA